MTDNEFIAQMFLQAKNLRAEVEALRAIDVQALVERVFNEVFEVENHVSA